MKRISSVILTSLSVVNFLTANGAYARNEHEHESNNNNQQQEQARANQERESRSNAEHEARQQEDNARKAQQEGNRKQQEEARQAQQQAGRQQQQEQRKEQEQAARQQQQEQKRQQEQAGRQQQEQQKREQEQASKQQQQEQKREQQQAQRQQQQQQEQLSKSQQREQGKEQERAQREQPERLNAAMMPPERGTAGGAGGRGDRGFNPAVVRTRPADPRPLSVTPLPLNKAISMPYLAGHVSAEEQEHASAVMNNLQEHLVPVAPNFAPQNMPQITNYSVNNYLNNYQTYVNNQPIVINSGNTFFNPIPQYQYPYWYHPEPGWAYSNGFSLGNLFHVPMNWLGFGWHPYYGPPPEGFICASNFVPTPWIYVPAYGLWRQPGIPGWAPYGPPYDYTGPITVQILEPRHVEVMDPYTGGAHAQTMNVIYLYNAFYYPEMEHWGYMNRRHCFVWINA